MKQWYTLRSKPKQELLARRVLADAQLEVFLPETMVHRQHGKPPVRQPFFPGYLFGRLDSAAGEIRRAAYSPGVSYVVGFGDGPALVPDDVVASLQERLARSQGATDQVALSAGDRVVITRGPLKDLDAIFDRRLSATGRVRVLIRMLERVCAAELPIGSLRRPTQAASLL